MTKALVHSFITSSSRPNCWETDGVECTSSQWCGRHYGCHNVLVEYIKILQVLLSTRVGPADDDLPLYKWGLKVIQAGCWERAELLIYFLGRWLENSRRHHCSLHWHTFFSLPEIWLRWRGCSTVTFSAPLPLHGLGRSLRKHPWLVTESEAVGVSEWQTGTMGLCLYSKSLKASKSLSAEY